MNERPSVPWPFIHSGQGIVESGAVDPETQFHGMDFVAHNSRQSIRSQSRHSYECKLNIGCYAFCHLIIRYNVKEQLCSEFYFYELLVCSAAIT